MAGRSKNPRRRGRAAPWLPLLLLAAVSCGAAAGSDVASSAGRELDAAAEETRDPSPPAAPDVPLEAPRVAFLGDSIGAGLHLPADQAFPAVLQRTLAEDGLPFHLLNASVSGDSTAGGLNRVDWVLRDRPDVLVVELGGNDGLRGARLEVVESNLRAIVAKAREAGARVLLLGIRIPPNYGPDYAEGFAAIYPRLADELDVALVSFFMADVGGRPELNLADGLHPSAEGHRVLAAKVAPALKALLRSLP